MTKKQHQAKALLKLMESLDNGHCVNCGKSFLQSEEGKNLLAFSLARGFRLEKLKGGGLRIHGKKRPVEVHLCEFDRELKATPMTDFLWLHSETKGIGGKLT